MIQVEIRRILSEVVTFDEEPPEDVDISAWARDNLDWKNSSSHISEQYAEEIEFVEAYEE